MTQADVEVPLGDLHTDHISGGTEPQGGVWSNDREGSRWWNDYGASSGADYHYYSDAGSFGWHGEPPASGFIVCSCCFPAAAGRTAESRP